MSLVAVAVAVAAVLTYVCYIRPMRRSQRHVLELPALRARRPADE